jgi:hypothetical protein
LINNNRLAHQDEDADDAANHKQYTVYHQVRKKNIETKPFSMD